MASAVILLALGAQAGASAAGLRQADGHVDTRVLNSRVLNSSVLNSSVLNNSVLISSVLVAPSAAGRQADSHVGSSVLNSSVLAAPSPFSGTDKRRHLVYEILVQNVSPSSIRLDRLEVRDPSGPPLVATYDDRAIGALMFGFDAGTFTRTLGPDETGLLLLDVSLRPGTPVPTHIDHRFGLSLSPDGTARRLTITGARTGVEQRAPIRISPPLRGRNLGVIGCCGAPFGHRLALTELDGGLFLAQRYAIDFLRLDDQLNTFVGDPTRNESYLIFGAQVMAATPGRVVATRDGVPENTPPNPPAGLPVNDLAGNFVIQDLGGGHFALYAHLQTGSVRVSPGDRVRRGQVLGLVGNTGNSTGPHLHFQVTDGPGVPSGLAANGVPYVFDRFRLDARVIGLDSDPPAPVRVPAPPPPRRAGQYPFTGDIVAFPEADHQR